MDMKKFAPLLFAGALVIAGAATAWAASQNHNAHLTGAAERPIPVDTNAQGQATFKVADDGQSIEYKLNVSNLDGVIQAHIHLGSAEVAGPVVVFLFGPVPGGVDSEGRLATGTITAANLIGPLAGRPLSDLIAAIEAGNTYVNVHTSAHTGGEIRGQI
jgi:hypothetical protein